MANLTRLQMQTELQSRGWSRFAAADLQRYLDWALQDMYGMARYERSTMTSYTDTAFASDTLTFATITGAAAELVQQIVSVHVEKSGEMTTIPAATWDEWLEIIKPNTQATNPELANLPSMYYVFDLALFFYPKVRSSAELTVHYLLREDTFASDSDTSALPERFDKAIIAQAETHCCRRARDMEAYAVATNEVRRFLLDELGMAAATMGEEVSRIEPWRG